MYGYFEDDPQDERDVEVGDPVRIRGNSPLTGYTGVVAGIRDGDNRPCIGVKIDGEGDGIFWFTPGEVEYYDPEPDAVLTANGWEII